MNKPQAKERIYKLRKEINHHRYLYHVLDRQEISDAALDSLKEELVKMEKEYPEFITSDSPTQRVAGEPLKEFKKVAHAKPMLSLEDVFDNEEFNQWLGRVIKFAELEKPPEIFAELKFDGLALALIYEGGILKTAATRGDGQTGEDVTQNIKTIEAIPLLLRKSSITEKFLRKKIEVRGEVLISKENFERINKEQAKNGNQIYANPRNLAAGSVRQLDSNITASRRLDFYAYGIASDLGISTHEEEHKVLSEFGFKTDKFAKSFFNPEGIFEFHKKIAGIREKIGYGIDGIVIQVNDHGLFRRLGVVGKAPRGAVAFKFAPIEATTIVENIVVQVGRTGALTPVAHLRPVRIGGVTVSRATLHNEDEIKRLDVKIGDTVIVGRAGDVIPDVKKVIVNLRTGREKKFQMPINCPMCGHKIKRDGVIHRCVNAKCPARHRENLYHFVSRPAFDIDGLGPKIIDALVDNGLINDAADIFDLREGDLSGIERFAEKSSKNLVEHIADRKKISLTRFLFGLGILHVGEETARDLADFFSNIGKIQNASIEDLEKVPNIGSVVGASVYGWFRDQYNKKFLQKLLNRVKIEDHKKKIGSRLSGKTFVLTGALESISRQIAKEKIRNLGGSPASSVSNNTDYVVVGENAGSKLEKARKLGLKIITETEFLKMIK